MDSKKLYDAVVETKSDLGFLYARIPDPYRPEEMLHWTKRPAEYVIVAYKLLTDHMSAAERLARASVLHLGFIDHGYMSFSLPSTKDCLSKKYRKEVEKQLKRGYIEYSQCNEDGEIETLRVHKNRRVSINPYRQ